MQKSPEQDPQSKLQTPHMAAIAGIIFAILLAISIILIGIARPSKTNDWVPTPIWMFALNIVPLTGIAFLWFMGVVRSQIGQYEDRFFATVFLGSGLLFLAMLFAAAAMAGSFEVISGPAAPALMSLDKKITSTMMNVYAMKMAAVFMISTSTILLRTGVLPRWLAYTGFVLALINLLTTTRWELTFLLFPLWVLLLSVVILVKNLHNNTKRRTNTNHPQC